MSDSQGHNLDFRTVSVIKHPVEQVWAVLRDDIHLLVDLLEDIESITVQSAAKHEGVHRIVRIWKATPRLPEIIARRLKTEGFTWTDSGEWNDPDYECRWEIEPHGLGSGIRCDGTTRLTEALGGRGTRIAFAGELRYIGRHSLGIGVLEWALYEAAVGALQNLVPKNFRKTLGAVTQHLDRGGPGSG